MPQEKMPQVSDKELMMSNTLMIQPEYREEFLMELREILPQARRLEACISLEIGEVADQPGMFVLSERWRNGNEYLNEILQLPLQSNAFTQTKTHHRFTQEKLSCLTLPLVKKTL